MSAAAEVQSSAVVNDGSFRNYADSANHSRVENNYFLNHSMQTREFVEESKKKYCGLSTLKMSIWEAIELLNDLTDDSDPDTDLKQIVHALQTAEACRQAYPSSEYDWFHLVGLIHDLGKVLAHTKFGSNPQWAVVGDTFPVGCSFSPKIVFPHFFNHNPDLSNPRFNSRLGIYTQNCGLDKVDMSWGHDEFMYCVLKGNGCTLPPEALFIVRYHSFYPLHQEGEYMYLLNEEDKKMLPWLKTFQKCDLYTKHQEAPDVKELMKYYKGLIEKYFPNGDVLSW